MMYQIQNSYLTVQAQAKGAELQSIRSASGTEYLWQGDPTYWSDRAPNIFPYVARLTEGRYTFGGKSYSLPIHGFAPTAEFTPEVLSGSAMRFTLETTPALLEQYPFPCRFSITYSLDENTLHVTMTVDNLGEEAMYFGLGGHPGIRVPLEDGLDFSDYILEFPEDCTLWQEEFSSDCFPTGVKHPFPLHNGTLALDHHLFDEDAVILSHPPRQVTLRSSRGRRGVTMDTGGLAYLGLWHRPRTDAPYLCIEPWSSLPSRKGIVEDLSTQPNLLSLLPGATYQVTWSLSCF